MRLTHSAPPSRLRVSLNLWLTVGPHALPLGKGHHAMASVFCTQCGQQNPDDSKFCARCGSPLSLPSSGSTGTAEQTTTISMSGLDVPEEHGSDDIDDVVAESLPAGTALLVVKRGPNAGSRFLLDKELTSGGRHP